MRLRLPFPATVLAFALSSAAVVLTKDASWAEALHRYLSVRGRGLSGPLWFFSAFQGETRHRMGGLVEQRVQLRDHQPSCR